MQAAAEFIAVLKVAVRTSSFKKLRRSLPLEDTTLKPLIRNLLSVAMLAAGIFTSQAQAGVVVAGTRVIFPAQEREVTVKLTNEGVAPALVKVWLDSGNLNEAPEKISVPFTLTPPMFRIDPKKGQTLRIIYTNEPLAKDRESLFWLNVLEVPPKPQTGGEANTLQLALRTRIKLIYRPQGLAGTATEAPAKVRWELVRTATGKGYALKGSNPTSYVVNLGAVSLITEGRRLSAGSGFIMPGASEVFPIQDLSSLPAPGAEVTYSSINDWGGSQEGKQLLSPTGS